MGESKNKPLRLEFNRRLISLVFLIICSLVVSQAYVYSAAFTDTKEKRIGGKSYRVKLLFEDKFKNMNNWVIEGVGKVSVKDNTFDWNCFKRGGGTAWCKKRFDGPTIVEYDVMSKEGQHNINFFFYAAKMQDGKNVLLETKNTRSGGYKEYHSFQNYIITYVMAGKRTRIRFRKDPGFSLISQGMLKKELIKYNVWQHVSYVFDKDGSMSIYANDEHLHTFKDAEKPYRAGYHGFRTYHNHICYKNFRVYQIVDQ